MSGQGEESRCPCNPGAKTASVHMHRLTIPQNEMSLRHATKLPKKIRVQIASLWLCSDHLILFLSSPFIPCPTGVQGKNASFFFITICSKVWFCWFLLRPRVRRHWKKRLPDSESLREDPSHMLFHFQTVKSCWEDLKPKTIKMIQ